MQMRASDFDSLRNVLISMAMGLGPQPNYRVVALSAGFPYESSGDRQYFAYVLGEISKIEHLNNAPLLSVLVVHKGNDPIPGEGFYKLAVELGRLRNNSSDIEKEEFTFSEMSAAKHYWSREQALEDLVHDDELIVDLEDVSKSFNDKEGSDFEGKSKRRRGHDRFVAALFTLWKYKCSVTGYSGSSSLLRASHIKAWSESNSNEKVDRYNGLLLIPNLDVAFDRHLISFDGQGIIVISRRLISPEKLGIDRSMKLGDMFLNSKQGKYLALHREKLENLDSQLT